MTPMINVARLKLYLNINFNRIFFFDHLKINISLILKASRVGSL